ncbi:hypothetical protein AB1K83_07670 [Sporosarcina sp. 179-K 3D1 HS]|uniref:hypothetical protein n=1 Tax=Sporosarcina sp. 179-K 3D1 HS TaxID=3232169 RepID=UPI00399FB4BA
MINRSIIDEIVEEVLKKLEGTFDIRESKKKPTLLVMNASDKVLIEQLQKHWEVLEATSANEYILENVNEVLFLDVTQDLLVKGAIGISDTPESELLAKALLRGLRIHFVPSPLLEWTLDVDYNKAMNKEYAKHILNYKKVLETFGVHMTSFTNFVMIHSNVTNEEKVVASDHQITFQGRLLTKMDVEKIKDDKICVCQSTIITPLARDVARELGKSIDVIDTKGMKL